MLDSAQDLIDQSPPRGLGGQPVEDPAPVGEPFHQSARSKQAQMAGDARLTLLHDLAQFHDRQLFAGEQGDDAQP